MKFGTSTIPYLHIKTKIRGQVAISRFQDRITISAIQVGIQYLHKISFVNFVRL